MWLVYFCMNTIISTPCFHHLCSQIWVDTSLQTKQQWSQQNVQYVKQQKRWEKAQDRTEAPVHTISDLWFCNRLKDIVQVFTSNKVKFVSTQQISSLHNIVCASAHTKLPDNTCSLRENFESYPSESPEARVHGGNAMWHQEECIVPCPACLIAHRARRKKESPN